MEHGYVRILLICTLLTAVSCNRDMSYSSYIEAGDTLPVFSVELSDGSLYDSSEKDTIPVLIVFFHTECPDCQKEIPVLQQLSDDQSLNFRLLLFSREQPSSEIETYWTAHNLTMPYTAQTDRTIYNKFANSGIPRGYLSNRQNLIVYTFSDNDMPNLEQLKTKIIHTDEL